MHVWNRKDKAMEKKGTKSGSIRKDNNYKPGAAVSLDQLQTAKLRLVPQLSGYLTSA